MTKRKPYFYDYETDTYRNEDGTKRRAPSKPLRDKGGYAVDSAGKKLPGFAVDKPPRKRAAQRVDREKVFDGERWRLNGRFTSAPTAKKIRRDKQGYPIDARGRRVRFDVVKGEEEQRAKQERKRTREAKKPRAKKRPVVETIGVGEIAWSTREYHLNSDLMKGEPENVHFKNFSNVNKQSLEDRTGESNIAQVFNQALEGHIAQGPFERDEVTIYDYGIHLRPESGTFDQKTLDAITERLAGTGATVTRIQEGPGHDSIIIGIGNNKRASTADQTEARIRGATETFNDIHIMLEDLYGDVYWDMWWDTEDEMY